MLYVIYISKINTFKRKKEAQKASHLIFEDYQTTAVEGSVRKATLSHASS